MPKFGLTKHSSTSLAFAITMNWLNVILIRPNKINPWFRVTQPYQYWWNLELVLGFWENLILRI